MLSVFNFYQAFVSPVVRPGIVVLVLLGLGVGLSRAKLGARRRIGAWVVVACVLVGWYLTVIWAARSGLYQQHAVVMQPLRWMIALVVVLAMMRSASLAAALDAVPAWWLVALQTYRALGGFVILMSWSMGHASPVALSAGIGDALVGMLAPLAALYLRSGSAAACAAAKLWNWFGLADFAVNFTVATAIAPASALGLGYPAVMIPAFLAPFSAVLHGLSLWQLSRLGRRLAAQGR